MAGGVFWFRSCPLQVGKDTPFAFMHAKQRRYIFICANGVESVKGQEWWGKQWGNL